MFIVSLCDETASNEHYDTRNRGPVAPGFYRCLRAAASVVG